MKRPKSSSRILKRSTRRKFTAEKKITIVLEGFRRDTPIRDLCHREGIHPGTYYAWLKDFMEAGKDRLTRDTVRDATRSEVQDLRRENARLKQLVAELSLQVHVLKNSPTRSGIRSDQKKRPGYWLEARDSPELSCRQLAWKVTDSGSTYISESTVYRILKREGLIKPAEIIGFKAAKEYHRKTRQPNELWASDCCHLKVIDWGWYYLVTVMDDFSHFILVWDLKIDMTGGSLEEVVQQAVDLTGMSDVPLEDRTVLLSDNGAGYISQQFNEYLRLVGIGHITTSPFHPQTNGKIERYHRTLKGGISQVPYEMPSVLKEAIRAFIEYYNYRRYHEGLGNVTPYDIYTGRHLEIIQKRKEAKSRTLAARRDYNGSARKESNGP